ncbi:MAG: hypothetical protein AABX55_02445 [Nanoarchaeota archaeon]
MNICPRCKSDKIKPFLLGFTNNYICNNCGYQGPIVLEKYEKKSFKKQKLS